MKDTTIILAALGVGIGLGIGIANIPNFFPVSSTPKEDKVAGIYRYEDAKGRAYVIKLNKDKTCETGIHTSFDLPCTYTIEGDVIHFDNLNSSYDAIYGEDGLLQQNCVYKRFK